MKYHRIVSLIFALVFLCAGTLPAAAVTGSQSANETPVLHTQWTSYTNANWINDLAFDSEGFLWAATSGGAVRWNTETAEYVKYTSEYGLCSNQLSAVAVAPDGAIWLASMDNGISRLQNGTFTNYTQANGLPSNQVNDIDITSDGVVWAGTGEAVCSFDGENWKIYNDTPLEEDQVTATHILCSTDGSIWFGTDFKGVY